MCRPRYAFVITLVSAFCLAHAASAGVNFIGVEPLNVAPNPDYMVTGDLNNDGKADVAVISPTSKEVDIYVAADTQSSFSPAQSLHFGSLLGGAAMGDLNNDGRRDLVVTDHAADGVWVLLGRGDGTFLNPYLVDIADSRGVISVAIGNFDDIGNPDLAVADDRTDRVFLLLNDNGTPPSFRMGGQIEAGSQPTIVLAGRFNDDDHPDIVTLNLGGPRVKDVSVVIWKRAIQGFPEFEPVQKYTIGEKPTQMVMGDFNNDAIEDLAILNKPSGSANSEVEVLMNNGTGVLLPPDPVTVPCPFFTGGALCRGLELVAGDFDGNGDVDLMVSIVDPRSSRGAATSLTDAMQDFGGRGDGKFVPGPVFGVLKAPLSMATGDFNSDGRPDIALGNRRTLDLQAFINTSTPGGTENGSPCLLGDECLSSRCLDGTCCASQCAVGERCNVPGREGICVPIPVTPITCSEPDDPCAKVCVSSTNAGAACTSDDECPGGDCVGQFCVDGFCCDSECIGGRCDAMIGDIDYSGVCIPGSLPGIPCIDNDECSTGICGGVNMVCCQEPCTTAYCDSEGLCQSLLPPGSPCDEDLQCASVVCDEFDAICCNRRCHDDEKCFEGACVPFDFTPSPTPTKSQPPTPTVTKTRRMTPGPLGESCSVNEECTSGFCTDEVCCVAATCPANQHCAAGNGMCTEDPPTPTPTTSRQPTLPTTDPCGGCVGGTHCSNGVCVKTSSSGGCSTGGDDPATGNLAVAALLPLGLWMIRRRQLRRVRVYSRAPRQ